MVVGQVSVHMERYGRTPWRVVGGGGGGWREGGRDCLQTEGCCVTGVVWGPEVWRTGRARVGEGGWTAGAAVL